MSIPLVFVHHLHIKYLINTPQDNSPELLKPITQSSSIIKFFSITQYFTIFTSTILLGLAGLLNIVAAQTTCVPSAGVRKEYNITFDDLDTTTNPVIPAPYTYNYLTFDPASWSVARNGSNIPFIPKSMSNALVTGPEYDKTVAEFSTLCSQDSFDLVSLWMIGCWVNPKYFANDTACLVNFSGTKTDGAVVSFERPVRKTTMEIIQDFPSKGFVNLKSFKMTTRFEIVGQTSGIPAGRIGLDNIVIERQDGKVTC